MNKATIERYARELERITRADPLVLHLAEKVTGEELDYTIYAYVREKVDGRSFIYINLLRSLIASSFRNNGFTMSEENICRVMPIFRRKSKEGEDDDSTVQILM